MASLIPANNGKALAAYYCGIFSLIPCLGLVLGPAAFVLGMLGLKAFRANPSVEGRTHAMVGVILGAITGLAHIAILLFVAAGAIASR